MSGLVAIMKHTKVARLLYSSQVYYVAIVVNGLVRFGWIIYTPATGPHTAVRAGILGTLEAIRRFQWNFCTYPVFHVARRANKLATSPIGERTLG